MSWLLNVVVLCDWEQAGSACGGSRGDLWDRDVDAVCLWYAECGVCGVLNAV
jgi:hypothetical protein